MQRKWIRLLQAAAILCVLLIGYLGGYLAGGWFITTAPLDLRCSFAMRGYVAVYDVDLPHPRCVYDLELWKQIYGRQDKT